MFNMFGLYERPMIFLVCFLIIAVWDLVWKGLSLWHSAKNRQKGWFIALLILNTAGLLPIIYLIWFKPKEKIEALPVPERPRVTKVTSKKARKRKR